MDWSNFGPDLARRVRQEMADPEIEDVSAAVMIGDDGSRRVVVTTTYKDGTVVGDKAPVSRPDPDEIRSAMAGRIRGRRRRRP